MERGTRCAQDGPRASSSLRCGHAAVDNPEAFVSVVNPSTGACTGGDSIADCQFGSSGRNSVRGPHFTDSDVYMTKNFKRHEGLMFRFDTQLFDAFNHPNSALPSNVEAGVPGRLIPACFGTLQGTISPLTGLLGVAWAATALLE